ncbi:MAG TPA: nucleotidyltransferase family protein, partial [Vicinamibacterales bacterium]
MPLSPGELAVCRMLSGVDEPLTPALLEVAVAHRVHWLLAAGPWRDASGDLSATLQRELRQAAAFDAWCEQDLTGLLDALATAAIDVLLMKGAALAYLIYDSPHLRVRVDTDLLIRREQLEAAERVLAVHGWRRPPESNLELAGAQRHYEKPAAGSRRVHLDVHWRIANPRTFSDALSFDEISDRAVPVPPLGRAARAPGTVDALFLACLHRVAHHDDEVDLLWLWDIHLLFARLSVTEEAAFVALALRTAMTGVCARGLSLVASAFATPGAATLASRLRAAGAGRSEPAARFLGGARPIATLRADLTSVSSWRLA